MTSKASLKSLQQSLIASFHVPPNGKKIAAAVSGGCDSVAMLFLLSHYARMKKIELCVFHVDHALREESEEEQKWVEKLAKSLKLDFFYCRANKTDLANNTDKGTENWARDFRYNSFIKLIEQSGADFVATGHTADDQIETVIMRLLRGSSLRALGGIRPIRQLRFNASKITVWRPLLSSKRSDLEKYLTLLGQTWLDDQTNFGTDYLRNRVRNLLLPVLDDVWEGGKYQLLSFVEKIDDLSIEVTKKAKRYLKQSVSHNSLDVSKMLTKPVRQEVLRLWLLKNNLGGKLSFALIKRLDEMWTKKSASLIDLRSIYFKKQNKKISCFVVNR